MRPAELSLDQWLRHLERAHPVAIELGLDRIRTVADRLGLARPAPVVITVAGTNGKGSCVRTLEAILAASGIRVGAYTSPHILRYNERVRIDGKSVDDRALCQAFEQIERARGNVSLTYFEVGTLAAFLIMADSALDVAVLEVGLGGRFDAVNIIDPDIAVITSIALDHTDWLGDTRDQIALEKAGIARPGKPLICADPVPPASLVAYVDELGCEALFLGRDFATDIDDEGGLTVSLCRPEDSRGRRELRGLPVPMLPLPSVAAALQALFLLDVPLHSAAVYGAIGTAQLPGRFQRLSRNGREIILDVAHNVAAAEYLRRCLEACGYSRVNAVCAIMADKDIDGFILALDPVVGHWFVGDLADNERALPAAQFADRVKRAGAPGGVSVASGLPDAFERALVATEEGGCLVVCGSFYTVAAILAHLEENPDAGQC